MKKDDTKLFDYNISCCLVINQGQNSPRRKIYSRKEK